MFDVMEILQMKVVCGVNFIKKKKNIRMNLNEYELMKEKKKMKCISDITFKICIFLNFSPHFF